MAKHNYYIRDSATFGKKINNEFVVINSRTESFFVLNQTGEAIYKTLGKKKALRQIEKQILSCFGIKDIQIRNDIKSFLDEGKLKELFKEIRQ